MDRNGTKNEKRKVQEVVSFRKKRSQKTSTESTTTKNLDKVIKESEKRKTASDSSTKDMKLENLINSLPDRESGILIQHLVGDDVNFKCVKCYKTFGSAKMASIHYSSCSTKLKKTAVSMNDIVWICTLCHLHFKRISELLKHRILCSVCTMLNPVNKAKDSRMDHFELTCTNKCKKCSYVCRSPIIFKRHLCIERLNRMKNCYVKVDQIPKNISTLTYYNCHICEENCFSSPHLLSHHMAEKHSLKFDGTFKPSSLQIENIPIKSEPVADECDVNIMNQNSITSSSNEQHDIPELDTSQPYQFQTRGPIDGERLKKFVGCNCQPQNGVEDHKPCLECLKNFALVYRYGKTLDESTKLSNELFKPSTSNSDNTPPRTPTPPRTTESHQSAHYEGETIELEAITLKLSSNHPLETVRLCALTATENSSETYACIYCLSKVQEKEIVYHLQQQHNVTERKINVLLID